MSALSDRLRDLVPHVRGTGLDGKGHVRDMQRQRLPFDESDVRDLIHAAQVFAKSGWPRLTNAARRNLPVVVLPVGPSGAA